MRLLQQLPSSAFILESDVSIARENCTLLVLIQRWKISRSTSRIDIIENEWPKESDERIVISKDQTRLMARHRLGSPFAHVRCLNGASAGVATLMMFRWFGSIGWRAMVILNQCTLTTGWIRAPTLPLKGRLSVDWMERSHANRSALHGSIYGVIVQVLRESNGSCLRRRRLNRLTPSCQIQYAPLGSSPRAP